MRVARALPLVGLLTAFAGPAWAQGDFRFLAGSGVNSAMRYARPMPNPIPIPAPAVLNVADSIRNCARIHQRNHFLIK